MKKRIPGLLILLLLVSVLLTSGAAASDTRTYGDFTTRTLRFGEVLRKGVDVSEYNGNVDWQSLADNGVEFAIVRVGGRYGASGKLFEDSYYQQNIEGAQAVGIRVGVYIFSQAITEEEAREEFRYVQERVQGYELDLPVVLDYEYLSNSYGGTGRLYKAKLTKKVATGICNAFCEEAAANGYTAMVYANPSMLEGQLNASDLSAPVWLANYTSQTSYSGSYTMWQCSENGTVGSDSDVFDLDFWYDASGLVDQDQSVGGPYLVNGSAAAGWIKYNGSWYYFTDGIMQTSWLQDNGKQYYLDPSSGQMVTGLQTLDGKQYYLNNSVQTGWQKLDGKWYYFNPDLQTGWQKINGKWYYLDPDSGAMLSGWQYIDGSWYYLNNAMATGWQKVDGKWYYLDPSSGAMKTGWQKIDGKWYYLNNSMQTGWQKVGGKWYYLNSSMVTGWLKLDDKWYYLNPSGGAMVSGCTMKINGKSYTFDARGVWTGA